MFSLSRVRVGTLINASRKGITPGAVASSDCERVGGGARQREGREKRERVAFFAASYAQATRFLRELALSSRLDLGNTD